MKQGLSLVRGPAPALEEALARYVADAQREDPLAPVAVVIGGTLMRPYLQRRLARLNGGIVNVRFLTPSELALVLGERALVAAGRRPLPPLADRILARQAAADQDGYFAPVRDAPGFGDALFHLFRELRGAGYDAASFRAAVSGVCEAEGKDEALAALFERLLEQRAGFYGPDDCMLSADPDSAPWRAIAVYGLWEAAPALRACLERLAERLPLALLLPTTETDADSATAELRDWALGRGAREEPAPDVPRKRTGLSQVQRDLFRREPEPEPLDDSLQLLSGPDPAREVREVARTCLAWAREGIRFHEMAVAYRHAEEYRPLIEAVFAEARIPVYLHEGRPLIERPVGRRAAALLELTAGDLDRQAVMDFVTDTRLPKETREAYGAAPAARWDRISRSAGIVEGANQWHERLARYRDEHDGNEAEQAEQLRRFVLDLRDALRDHPDSAPWSDQLAALRRLLERYVADPECVLDPLEGLGRFDALGVEVGFDRFRETVVGAIETLRTEDVQGPRGAFARRGVNVLDVNSLRHLSFRAVAIVGLAERAFPSPPRQDSLLLDHEREALNDRGPAPIPLRARRPDPEPLQFALAVSAARERLVASYPRKSAGDARPKLPSVFFRALAEAAIGSRVSAEDVDRLPPELYERVSGSRIGARSTNVSLSEWERDRTLIEANLELGRAALVAAEPRMQRAFEARAARLRPALTPYDALLDERGREALASLRDPDRAFSPSGLETYAVCPHRYFLASVLRANPVEEPEATIRISPLAKGSLVHRILERFLAEPSAKGEPLLHGAGEHNRLRRIADEECDRAEDRGETGYPLAWRYDRSELREDLDRWLEHERADPSFRAMPEGDFEVRFGPFRSDGEEGRLSRDEPLEIIAAGVRLRVAGRIDRLNWDEGRTGFKVIDYKTGKVYDDHADGDLRGGRALQLPLYLLAGAELTGIEASAGSAEYHFATRKGAFARRRFTGGDLRERRENLERLLSGIAESIRAGEFEMAPHEDACRFCDFDRLCPAGRRKQIDRKSGDPVARRFAELREIP